MQIQIRLASFTGVAVFQLVLARNVDQLLPKNSAPPSRLASSMKRHTGGK